MKKAITIFLAIFVITMIALIVISIFNPWNLRNKAIGSIVNAYLNSTVTSDNNEHAATSTVDSAQDNTDNHPLLNEEQEKRLESYGIDVSKLPDNVTPAMEACFMNKLGETRANAIIDGAQPTILELVKIRMCLDQ